MKQLTVVFLLVFQVVLTSTVWAQSMSEVDWVSVHAIPFDTVEIQDDYSDLLPLLEDIGDARIVAMGEATHVTHEFFALKDRVFHMLVEESGFTIFAIESPMAHTVIINDYVNGTTDILPDELYGTLLGIWRTQEMIDLIEWMRSYNAAQPEPVLSFYGIDVHSLYPLPIENTVAYINTVSPDMVQWVETQFACLPVDDPQTIVPTSPQIRERAECYEATIEVHNWLAENQSVFVAVSSEEDFAWALRNAYLVMQSANMRTGMNGSDVRDEVMAENAAWLLSREGSDAKMFIWAHNNHVGYFSHRMGRILRDRFYGQEIITIGLSLHGGTLWDFSQSSVQIAHIQPAPADSYEYIFHQVLLPQFILDLRDGQGDVNADWLWDFKGFFSTGANYWIDSSESHYLPTLLGDRFDIIIHIEETTPSHSLLFSEE